MLNKENQIFASHYNLKKQLGRGGFSEVWLAEDIKAGIDVAIKIYAPGTGLGTTGSVVFRNEFSLVFNLNHSNLLKPTYFDIEDNMPYLVMPFIEKGSVSKLIGTVSESDMWNFMHDVADGLAYLHSRDVIHQDIKPDNIMIADDGKFLITDFGVSTRARSTLRKSVNCTNESAGTQAYMAPERFSKEPMPVKANDIWSLGATAFELMTGSVPFGEMGGVLEKSGAEIPIIHGDYSDELKALVEQCLSNEPWDRPKAEELRDIAYDVLHGKKHVEEKKEEPELSIGQSKRTVFQDGVRNDSDVEERELKNGVGRSKKTVSQDTVQKDGYGENPNKKKRKTVIYAMISVLALLVLAFWLFDSDKSEPDPVRSDEDAAFAPENVIADNPYPVTDSLCAVHEDSTSIDDTSAFEPAKNVTTTTNVIHEELTSGDDGKKKEPEKVVVNYKDRFTRLVNEIENLLTKAGNAYDVNSLVEARVLCDSLQFYREELGYEVYKNMHGNVKVRVNEKIDHNYNALINEANGYVENATTDSFDDYEAAIKDYELAIKLKYDENIDYEIQRLKNIVR